MVFPPGALVFHALATSTYINSAFADAATRFTAVETTANTASASIAAAANIANSGSLVKWGASGVGITPPAATLSRNTIKEFGAYASGPISTVVNYHGGYFTDYTVATPTTRFLPDGTTSHAAPSAGLERYDCVSMSLGVASPGISVALGTAVTIGTAGFPGPANAGDEVLYYVYTKAGMAGIKDVSDGTNGYIIPVALHNFRGGSGGGGGGTPLTNAVLGIGAGTPSNVIPILRGDATLGTVNSVNLDATDPNGSGLPLYKGWGGHRTDGVNSGSLADALRNFMPADLQSRIYVVSGTTIHVSASPGSECCIVYNGRSRTNVTDVSVVASGAFGTRWLWADLSSAPGFTLVLTSTSSPLNAWQVLLGTYLWDTVTLHIDQNSAPDFTPLFSAGSHQITPNLLTLPASGTSTSADAMTGSGWLGQTVLNGMSGVFTFSKNCHVRPMLYLIYTGLGAAGAFAVTFRMTIDGVAIPFGDQYMPTTNNLAQTLNVLLPTLLVAAGAHTIAVQAFINSASASFGTVANSKYLEMRVEN